MTHTKQYEFSYVSCVYGWSETGSAEIDELLNKVFGIREAGLFSEDVDVPPRKAEREYPEFVRKIEKICEEYRAMGWTTDCGDFSGDGGGSEELAYEAYFEKQIGGEHWLVYAVFKYFLNDGFGKSWLTIVKTRETDERFLEWLREWVEFDAPTTGDCVWRTVSVEVVDGLYVEVGEKQNKGLLRN